jgi:hypothetical protein
MNHAGEEEFKTLAIAFTVAPIIVAICVIQLFDRLRDYESWRRSRVLPFQARSGD